MKNTKKILSLILSITISINLIQVYLNVNLNNRTEFNVIKLIIDYEEN